MMLCSLFFLISCTPYLEMGIGHSLGDNIEGSKTVSMFEVGLEGEHGSCALNHISHPDYGKPFNNKADSYADTLICKRRFTLK